MLPLIGITASLLFSSCYIPQIIKLVKTKSSEDVSPLMYYICLAAYTLSIIYTLGAIGPNWILLLNYGSGIITSLITLCLILKYKK
jgi:uncharacterized protein with PQ loop repeat